MKKFFVIATTTVQPFNEMDEGDTATLFWNNENGFGSLSDATVYSEEEALCCDLPMADDPPIWVELPNYPKGN